MENVKGKLQRNLLLHCDLFNDKFANRSNCMKFNTVRVYIGEQCRNPKKINRISTTGRAMAKGKVITNLT